MIFAGSLIAWHLINNTKIENPVAEIYKDGELLYTFDLSHERGTSIGDKRHYNIIEIADGAIGVTGANCPDEICVNTGFVSNMPIICVPNRLEIRIVGGNSDNELDAVAR